MDHAITRAAGATPRAVGEFQGFIDGEPSVVWADRKNMPQVGDKLFALPRQAAAPRSWAILLTSANHGTVGPVGSTFSHAGEHHERVQVMEIVEAGAAPAPGVDLAGLVWITIDGTVIPLAAPSAPVGASAVLTDERIYDIAASSDLGIGDDEYEMSKRTAFARAIEREIAALASQPAPTVAPADPWRDAWKAMADKTIEILQRNIVPSGISDHDAICALLDIYDGPEYRNIGDVAQLQCEARQMQSMHEAKWSLPAAQAYLAAELDPAEPVYKVADLKSVQASTAGGRQEGGAA